jgi:hypothetical protein
VFYDRDGRVGVLTDAGIQQAEGGLGRTLPSTESSKQRAGAKDAQATAGWLSDAIAAVKESPDAFQGLARYSSLAPDVVGGLINERMTPEQIAARAAVFDITADKIHERYGAALVDREVKNAAQYLPRPTDAPNVIEAKLNQTRSVLRKTLERKGYVLDANDNIIGGPGIGTAPARPSAAPPKAPGAAPKATGGTDGWGQPRVKGGQ